MKRMLLAGIVAGACVAMPAAAFVQDGEDSTAATEASDYDPDAIRCERQPITGTRARRRRVCLTNAQWRSLRDEGNRDAEGIVNPSVGTPPPGGD
jgi:hypothetical protein